MTEQELDATLKNQVGSGIGTHWETCHLDGNPRHHSGCAVYKLVAEVRRQRQKIAELTNAARKVFKGPQDAKTQEDYDRRHAEMERDGLASLNDLMLGNGWANVEAESTLAHMARQVEWVRAETDRLREALTWAVGFIHCQHPNSYLEHEDMRNAASLVCGDLSIWQGEFQRVSCRAEVAEYERDQLKKLLAQHGIQPPESAR